MQRLNVLPGFEKLQPPPGRPPPLWSSGPVPGGECPQARGYPQCRAQSGPVSWVPQRGGGQRRVREEKLVCDVGRL